MDEESLRKLIAHIFASCPIRQAQQVLGELAAVLKRSGADEELVRLAEASRQNAGHLHAMAIAGSTFSREELEFAFKRSEEIG